MSDPGSRLNFIAQERRNTRQQPGAWRDQTLARVDGRAFFPGKGAGVTVTVGGSSF